MWSSAVQLGVKVRDCVCEQQRKYTNTNKFKIVQMNTRRIFGAEVVDTGGVSLCGEILALATQVGGEIVKLCIV